MALETKCLTPDANFTTFISSRTIASTVNLPFELEIGKEEAVVLEKLIHNQLELVLRSYFNGR